MKTRQHKGREAFLEEQVKKHSCEGFQLGNPNVQKLTRIYH